MTSLSSYVLAAFVKQSFRLNTISLFLTSYISYILDENRQLATSACRSRGCRYIFLDKAMIIIMPCGRSQPIVFIN